MNVDKLTVETCNATMPRHLKRVVCSVSMLGVLFGIVSYFVADDKISGIVFWFFSLLVCFILLLYGKGNLACNNDKRSTKLKMRKLCRFYIWMMCYTLLLLFPTILFVFKEYSGPLSMPVYSCYCYLILKINDRYSVYNDAPRIMRDPYIGFYPTMILMFFGFIPGSVISGVIGRQDEVRGNIIFIVFLCQAVPYAVVDFVLNRLYATDSRICKRI